MVWGRGGGDEETEAQFLARDDRESNWQSEGQKPTPWTANPRISPPDHSPFSQGWFCKQALRRAIQREDGLHSSWSAHRVLTTCHEVCEIHTHYFLPSSEESCVRYFYHIITHVETELQAVVGSSCEC